MASNQIVKIVFDFDLGNVPASAKKLSQYLKDNSLDLKFTKQSVDMVSASLNQFATAQGRAAMASAGTSGVLKKSNQQWMSLSLIVQDLPYGFRGIQNNLPALVGSFAAATGPIYLGFSILIAITTKYEKQIAQLIYGIDEFALANKKMNETLATNIGQAKSQIASDQALLKIINDTTKSTDERKRALTALKEEYKGNIELQKIDIEDGAKLTDILTRISEALIRKAKATSYASLIAEEETKLLKLQAQQGEETIKNLDFLSTVYGMATSGIMGFNSSLNVAKIAFSKQAKEINQAKANIQLYTSKLNENTDASIKNADAQTLDTSAIKKEKNKKEISERDKALAIIVENEKKAALQLYDERDKELRQVTSKYREQIDLATKYGQDTILLEEAWRAELASVRKKWDDKETKQAQDTAEKIAKIQLDTRFDLANAISKINDDFAKENIKNVEAELSSTLKATKGNYNAQASAIQVSIDKISAYKMAAIEAGYATEEYDKEIEKLKSSLEGLVDPLEQMEININNTLNSLATGALVELGTQIGNVFSGAEFSFDGFLKMMADGLIQLGTYLVSISTVFVAIKKLFETGGAYAELAIPIGLAAIATGVVIKNKLVKKNTPQFANGGIISGPTMGLMGEYPGAKSNPEVVAPLDKLKDMIGGGGGTLEARVSGNDLLILMNKAQRNNNLSF